MRTMIVAAILTAGIAQAQPVVPRMTSPQDRALLTQLVAREDSRELPVPGDARERGLASRNSYLRAFTVRGLGRLENPAVLPTLERMLGDESAEVRAAAADAIAQSVSRGGDSVSPARSALLGRLEKEHDPSARAMALEAFGRLPQGSLEQVKATANAIAPSLSASSVVERRGAIRGIFFLARKREARSPGAIPAAVTDEMFSMLDEPPAAGFTPTDRFNIAFALWGALALNDQRAHRLFADRETMVRERGIVNFARSTDTALIRAHLQRAMADTAPIIRYRSIGVYAQKLRSVDGCAPLIALSSDPDTTVALGAIDALSGCHNDADAARRLRSLAEGFADDDHWHVPVHAFVSLAVIDSVTARAMMSRFMHAKNFYVRMYADTAARLMRDVASLEVLSRDDHPNVRSSALAALSRLVGHEADSIYLRSLRSDDNQVLMAASAALQGSTISGVADSAEAAWRRRRARGWETDFDGQRALRELFQVGEDSGSVTMVEMPLPTFEDLAALERATVRIEMADGAVATMRLRPFDAPTNAFRFARLAKAGVFDGLTFHRVAPFFVVQGPGPNANEYSAPDKPFARDELAVSNVRGTVGLSTRGRDTADGQIYVNTVDNVWLDHEYTVMGAIVSGIEVFDRMQEGAKIRRISIVP